METKTDVLVVGGGLGGVAAALSALDQGMSVVLVEESEWLGGQSTTQAVPPDEHPWIERTGGCASYRNFRTAVRHYYRRHYPLADEARRRRHLNPGSSWASSLAHEPRVALAVIDELLQPHRSTGRLRVFMGARLAGVDVEGDHVRSATFETVAVSSSISVAAAIVIDATETGELLEVSGTEYVTGKESRRDTGEPHASDTAAPLDMQAFTVCLAIDYVPSGDHVIDRPHDFDKWRAHTIPGWPGPMLSWTAVDPRTLEAVTYPFEPDAQEAEDDRSHIQGAAPHGKDLWSYRRVIARRNFLRGTYDSDISILNWPQNDYTGGPLFGVPSAQSATNLQRARALSLSLLYWLQTEAPRPDGRRGWPGIRPRGDVVGSNDGMALRPYVRESRRIIAEYTVAEQDVALAVRGGHGAVSYADSVGTGYYRIDLHPTTGGSTFLDIPTCPYELPLGALLPVRVDNLIPAAKNIGTTHITNGCYRLHPTEWLIGDVAGRLAAYAIAKDLPPRAVRSNPLHLERFQGLIADRGVELRWPQAITAPADR